MCGIFALINNKETYTNKDINESFDKGKDRGPEDSELLNFSDKIVLGFKRLAINGINKQSSQPMTIDGITIVCNGEIYNYKQLFKMLNITQQTGSDCEVIIHMYKKYGFEYTVSMLDGVFAIVLYDTCDITKDPKLYVARDPLGVRPLYLLCTEDNFTNDYFGKTKTTENIIAFASEIKMLTPLLNKNDGMKKIENIETTFNNISNISSHKVRNFKIVPFVPGSYSYYTNSVFIVQSEWTFVKNTKYYSLPFPKQITNDINEIHMSKIHSSIVNNLMESVKKRVIDTCERPIACLLSGGLDSSLITALVKYYTVNNKLETYSIGMEGSEDLKNAKIVAEYLNTDHTEIIIKPDDFFNAIPEVIEKIESYDTTTVRASVGNYLVGKYISEHSEAKVIFNGDGSDELCGGYLYFLNAPSDFDFDLECKRLLTNIHTFDVLRSDRCISTNGLEPRTPFLDKTFVNSYLSIPIEIRNPLSELSKDLNNEKVCEKILLRTAFSKIKPDILPEQILWRTKEAFSDGVSGNSGSWFEIITKKLSNSEFKKCNILHNNPTTREQQYYRNIYENLYPNTFNNIPYFWMPRFVDAKDSSARTLEIYSKLNK
tara:strand:+ start:200 stop:2002 length:1803 start_codon:yes stop_codon:yes gene_type:complete